MANEIQFANAVIEIDTVVCAKVTAVRKSVSVSEVDVTGAEDVSGVLVDEQYIAVAKGETLEIEGITIGAGAAEYEPGQLALITALESGDNGVVLKIEKATGYGSDYVGFFHVLHRGSFGQGCVQVHCWFPCDQQNARNSAIGIGG